jgi:hypothetical protein
VRFHALLPWAMDADLRAPMRRVAVDQADSTSTAQE